MPHRSATISRIHGVAETSTIAGIVVLRVIRQYIIDSKLAKIIRKIRQKAKVFYDNCLNTAQMAMTGNEEVVKKEDDQSDW